MSRGLSANLSNNAGQSTSTLFQNFFVVSENSTDDNNNFCRKLMQDSL